MNDEDKKSVKILSSCLAIKTGEFLIALLKDAKEDGIDTSDLINIIFSAHLSSSFSLMLSVSKDNKPINDMVNKFIKGIQKSISEQEMITNVEEI